MFVSSFRMPSTWDMGILENARGLGEETDSLVFRVV